MKLATLPDAHLLPATKQEKCNNRQTIPGPPVVYPILVLMALVAGVITLGNQAEWWSIGE